MNTLKSANKYFFCWFEHLVFLPDYELDKSENRLELISVLENYSFLISEKKISILLSFYMVSVQIYYGKSKGLTNGIIPVKVRIGQHLPKSSRY